MVASYTLHLSDLIWNMPAMSGFLTPLVTSVLLKVYRNLPVNWQAVDGMATLSEELLAITNLPTLERRRLELKLCHLFKKIIHNLVFFLTMFLFTKRGHSIIILLITIAYPNLLLELILIILLSPTPFLSGIDSQLKLCHCHL